MTEAYDKGFSEGMGDAFIPENSPIEYVNGYTEGFMEKINNLRSNKNANSDFYYRLETLVDRIKLGMQCEVLIGQDQEVINGRLYLQIRCYRMDVITWKMGYGYGGKAYLSPHMTDSEIFQVAFGLYKGYWEHEARENFEIDGVRPFGPHISTEALISVAKKVDVRSVKHVEDTPPLTKKVELDASDGGTPYLVSRSDA